MKSRSWTEVRKINKTLFIYLFIFKRVFCSVLCLHTVSRSKDIVEPLMKPQWYVNCSDMGKQAADAVREGRLKIIPEHHLKTWFNWLDNIRLVRVDILKGVGDMTLSVHICTHTYIHTYIYTYMNT